MEGVVIGACFERDAGLHPLLFPLLIPGHSLKRNLSSLIANMLFIEENKTITLLLFFIWHWFMEVW